jgi:tape measure domain-containing protein
MGKERSTIELFFKALGHKDVQDALRVISQDAARTDEQLSRMGKKAGATNFANKLREDYARAIKEQAYLAKEMRRLQDLGSKNALGSREQTDLARLKQEYNNIGRVIRDLNRNGRRILDPGEFTDVERLTREFGRLGEKIRSVRNVPPTPVDPNVARAQALRDQYRRLLVDQKFLQNEISRLSRLGAAGNLGSADFQKLQSLRNELADVGRQIRTVKTNGKGLLDPNELKDVARLQDQWRLVAQQIREVKNSSSAPNSYASKLRGDLAGAVREQTQLSKEYKRLNDLGNKNSIGAREQADLARLKQEYRNLAKVLQELNRNGKSILNPNEIKDVDRLTREFGRLGAKIREVQNVPPPSVDPAIAKLEALRNQYRRLVADQKYVQSELNRLGKLGQAGALDARDLQQLQRLRGELAQIGNQIRSVKSNGRGLLDPNEIKDVTRLQEQWRRVAQQIREVKNVNTDPRIALQAGIKAKLDEAIREQKAIQSELNRLGRLKSEKGGLSDDNKRYLESLKRDLLELQRLVGFLNAHGIHLLSEEDVKRANRLTAQMRELQRQSDNFNRRQFNGAGLKTFASSLQADFGRLFNTMGRVGSFTFNTTLGGMRQLGSFALTAIRNLGGIVPVFNGIRGAVSAVNGAVRTLGFSILSAGFGVAALARGFQNLYNSNASLQGSVSALRALNTEINAANGRPVFASDTNGPGLRDINSGNAQTTAQDLAYLNQLAYQHGLSVNDLAGSYIRLKASTQGTGLASDDMQKLFKTVTATNTVLGGTEDNAKRAFIALGQMASKGKIYSEELKGQLAEALPGAVGIAARAYGMSVKDFNEMVQKEDVSAAEFIKKFSAQLEKEYGAAAESMANTSRVAFGRLKSAWENAKTVIASGKLDESMMRLYQNISNIFTALSKDGAFTRFGEKLAASIDRINERIELANKGGYRFEGVLDFLAKGFDTIVTVGLGVVDVFTEVKEVFSRALYALKQSGVVIPSVSQAFESLIDFIREVNINLDEGTLSGNPLADLASSLISVSFEISKMGLKALTGSNTFETFGDAIFYAAYWLGQLSMALAGFRTKKLNPLLDETGLGILNNLEDYNQKIENLKTSLKGLWGLLSGDKSAPVDATSGMKQAYGFRNALGNLVTGQDNVSSTDPNAPYDSKSLELAFQVRDIITNALQWIVNNKDTIGMAFQGMADAARGIADAFLLISDALKSVGIQGNVGYLLGALFAFSRIPGAVALATGAVTAFNGVIVGSYATAMAGGATRLAALGAAATTAGVAVAALAAAAVALYATYKVYERFDNQIKGGADLLTFQTDAFQARAGLNDLANSMKGNRNFEAFRNQGYDPAEAAQMAQYVAFGQNMTPEISMTSDMIAAAEAQRKLLNEQIKNNQSTADLMKQQQQIAANDMAANDNATFGAGTQAPATDPAVAGQKQPIIIDLTRLGLGVYEGNMDTQTVSELDNDVARARANGASSWGR